MPSLQRKLQNLDYNHKHENKQSQQRTYNWSNQSFYEDQAVGLLNSYSAIKGFKSPIINYMLMDGKMWCYTSLTTKKCNVTLRHKGINDEEYYAGICIILSLPTHLFLDLILMDPCIVAWFSRNNQQDATL
jgi:hypothetical protein